MVIFIDVIVAENFIVNFFLLDLTANTINVRSSWRRISIGAIVGAFYTLTILFKSLYIFTFIPVKALIAILMVYISLNIKNIALLVKGVVVFFLYTFTLAGIIIYGEYKSNAPMDGLIITKFSNQILLLAMMVLYVVISRAIKFIFERKKLKMFTYDVEISIKGTYYMIKALLDTGNELKEPVTNLPVIIVEKNQLLDSGYEGYQKLYIPYKAVDGSSNYLEAFKAEEIRINFDNNNCQSIKAIIAVTDNKLSEYDEYQALLSRGII